MTQVTRVREGPALVARAESDHPQQVAPSHGGMVELIEVETGFGTVAAGEQALIEAVRAVLAELDAEPDDELAED